MDALYGSGGDGWYMGNDKDASDGFIHLSTLEQLEWVANKVRSDSNSTSDSNNSPTPPPLLLLTLALHRAGDGYRLLWEAANSLRNQSSLDFVNLFCHVYGREKERASIDVRRCVVRVDRLERSADGSIILPSDLRTKQATTA